MQNFPSLIKSLRDKILATLCSFPLKWVTVEDLTIAESSHPWAARSAQIRKARQSKKALEFKPS